MRIRILLLALVAAVLAGCATRSPDDSPAPITERLRLTLDLRYPMGQTLDPDTRVTLTLNDQLVTAKLADCGMTAGPDFVRFTTGALVKPGMRCHVLVSPPDEPSQVFDIVIPARPRELGFWLDWRAPSHQVVSPMPARALLNQPRARQELTVPPARRFGLRYQLTPWNSPRDPVK